MISTIGNYFLITSLGISILALILKYFLENSFYSKCILLINKVLLICLSFSFILLIVSFITSDFTVVNVIEHSHTELPLLYKISASWGNHEGSMLLWTWIISCYITIFSYQCKRNSINITIVNMTLLLQQIILFFFILYLTTTSNPFLKYNGIVNNGTELTPVLQDPILAIHPPLIYLGYLAFIVITPITLSWGKYYNKISLNDERILFTFIRQWTLLSWSVLTLGIALGSWWAYYELGWGGWWFWDPVENSSLMPWLSGLSLLHTVQIKQKSDTINSWIFLISCLGFLLSLAATFFVRSGFLESVHSFANDSGRGIILLLFILLVLSYMSFIFYNMKAKSMSILQIKSKAGLILLNNIYITVFILIVLFATLYPSIYKLIWGTGISIGEVFFQSFLTPLVYSFLLIMSFVPLVIMNTLNKKSLIFVFVYFLGGNIISYYIIGSSSEGAVLTQTILTTLIYVYYIIYYKKLSFSLSTAHLAFCLLVIVICINTMTKSEFNLNLNIGDSIIFNDSNMLLLRDFNNLHGINYKSSYADFTYIDTITDRYYQTFPEKKFFYLTNTYITKPYILSNCFEDLYLVLGEGNLNEGWSLKIHREPFMIGIWTSAVLFVLSGLYSLSKTSTANRK